MPALFSELSSTSDTRQNLPLKSSEASLQPAVSPPPASPVELLSPAGSVRAMHMAFTYGADAIYAGQPRFSLRVRNNEFDLERLGSSILYARAHHKKFYVVVNLAPHNAKIKNFAADMAPVIAMNPHALIVSDPGIIHLLKESYPEMPLHLSVQANTLNWAAVKFWQQVGIERVILSRELGIDEIAEIKQRCPEMELEVFVHGALCMAYSGRCLISNYVNKRDPNQGACTNACRWEYKASEATEVDQTLMPAMKIPASKIPTIEIPTKTPHVERPESQAIFVKESASSEYYALEEDEHGSYLFNSRDLRAVAQVEKLIRIGVNSMKIEGRTKSPYYVGRTAQIYRRAIDAACSGQPFDENLLKELDGLANRGYTEGFLERHKMQPMQNYEQGSSVGQQQVVGEVTGKTAEGRLQIFVKNKFSLQDALLLMTPKGNVRFTLLQLFDKNGQPMESALGSGHQAMIGVPTDEILNHLDDSLLIYCMLIKELPTS
jgi:U32 family peptidase